VIPTGRIYMGDMSRSAEIILGPDVVTYRAMSAERQPLGVWKTVPLSDLRQIEWDAFPFDPPEQLDEIEFLRQFITNLSVDELEAAINARIGIDEMHRMGEWVKAALLSFLPERSSQ
jgi:hypothetical protein